MYALVMTIDQRYWEQDRERHRARQAEKEALKSHSQKQGKASTSGSVMASQSKTNPFLVASSAKNLSSKPSPFPAPKKQPKTPWVDLSSKLASNGKLTSDKHKKRLKNNLVSIVVQETISWTPIPRSRLWSLPRAAVLQQLLILRQLLPRNPWKNRERPPGLRTDWGSCWTPLCSNESDSTQHIYSFWLSFIFHFPYFSLDPWSGLP